MTTQTVIDLINIKYYDKYGFRVVGDDSRGLGYYKDHIVILNASDCMLEEDDIYDIEEYLIDNDILIIS